jgi:hypothetical protein
VTSAGVNPTSMVQTASLHRTDPMKKSLATLFD